MSNVRELHNQAISYAQQAMREAHLQNEHERIRLISEAMRYEVQAAELLPEEKSAEPTRSILYRSAASFAYQAGNLQEAERLVFKGLSGYPTPISKAQLLDVQSLIQDALTLEDSERESVSPFRKTINAIYENGVLRPMATLPLSERQSVTLRVYPEVPVPALA